MSIKELCEMVCSGAKSPDRPCWYYVRCVEYGMKDWEGMNYLRESVEEDMTFNLPEEILPYLFDKDLFGWEVESYDISHISDTGVSSMNIKLYRMR